MNRILVTGASGFVGSSLCNQLCECGIPFFSAVRKKRTQSDFEIGNLTDEIDWSKALLGCNAVIHLAARVHMMNDKSSNPLAIFRAVNVDATLNLAKQAALSGVHRFVFVSSVKVNGEETAPNNPFTVFDQPAPTDPYGQSKLEAEIALRELSQATGLEVVIIRPPLVYGPGVRANFLKLMQLVQIGVPLPLGAIHTRRSMVSLDNLIDLLIICTHHPAAAGQTFMVSDDYDVSISELLHMLGNAMGKRSLLLPIPAKVIAGAAALVGKSAVARRLLRSLQVDINHTKLTLGWKPVVSMQESVNKTVAYFLAKH
jgi:nucleoside-diphosphate-sugar epimerase